MKLLSHNTAVDPETQIPTTTLTLEFEGNEMDYLMKAKVELKDSGGLYEDSR